MKPTKKEWEEIEGQLRLPWGQVRLDADGYELLLQVQPRRALSYCITAFVNGAIKGKYMLEDCEERRRFMRPVNTYLHRKRLRDDLAKKLSKRDAQRMGVNQKITYYLPTWPSFQNLRRHLIRHNECIEVLEIGYSAEALGRAARSVAEGVEPEDEA